MIAEEDIAAVFLPDVGQLLRVTADGHLVVETADDPASEMEPPPPFGMRFANAEEALAAMALWVLAGEEEDTTARILGEIKQQSQQMADSGFNAPIRRIDTAHRAQTIEELIRRFKRRR